MHEVALGFPPGVNLRVALDLMGSLEEAADMVLASLNLERILCGPSPDGEE